MNSPQSSKFIAVAIGLLFAISHACLGQKLTIAPYKPTGTYALGETVGWNISLALGVLPLRNCKYTIKENNFTLIKSGDLDFSAGPAKIEVSLNEPAMIFVQITSPDLPAATQPADRLPDGIILGAAVAPEKIQPSTPAPPDFDEFWNSKIKGLNDVPPNPVLTPGDSGRSTVEYDTIKMDNINGAHVQGQIAKPKKDGKFPGLVIFQYAGPPYPLQKQSVTSRAAQGWLALNIEPHDVLPTAPKSYYAALPDSLKNYHMIGRDDREKNYFLQMYLADYRAVDYIASRPDWDGKTLVVMGTSMGGQQSLCVAGLNPKITHLIVDEPAGCDSNGPLHGRASGYPNWPANNPKIMETALYFDAVNFAPHIKAQSLVAMGFVDTTAPPIGIWSAFNQIQGPKEAAPMIDSPHNNHATNAQQRPYTSRSEQWLRMLVKGDPITATENYFQPADIPSPRTDTNSQLAHKQLLQKAKSGHIDVYFEGDSITRRWGTSDEQYKNFYANWKQNFFGWNAADFGWGGDTTQNILWRLSNGELDNVNPKIIVLMAGTNNIGNETPPANDDARIASVTRGIKSILDICQQKAPHATIVLMGITPRNDNMAVIPSINRINENISKFANGQKIRFININDKLADQDGKLLDGMTGSDHLHLALPAYQIWADALKPIFTEILGPPTATDLAPPPTGDPSNIRK